MFRELSLILAEIMFGLTGGVPLVYHWIGAIWGVTLVVVGAVLMSITTARTSNPGRGIIKILASMVAAITLFMFGLGVPIVQLHELSECRTKTIVTEELTFEVIECRNKENHFGEFSDWEIRPNAIVRQ